ncbi:hypothetical protein PR202_ga17304 [Eleusine coracana subsp. coracana]|uniref:Uncharacterized protein n=1 Tax=Eleusine coracana subsp. coracana TaxID=191504 RepID=A0AAV5CPR4_ELECO|nr:hypothetical protein PR202_ga17304 [Eleusine coracana subsp. coracana]
MDTSITGCPPLVQKDCGMTDSKGHRVAVCEDRSPNLCKNRCTSAPAAYIVGRPARTCHLN